MSRYTFTSVGGAVFWRSAKQPLVATVTMETEFIYYLEATSLGICMMSFISRFWVMIASLGIETLL